MCIWQILHSLDNDPWWKGGRILCTQELHFKMQKIKNWTMCKWTSCIYIKLHNNNDQWCEYDMEKAGDAMLICVLLVNICHV